MLENSREPMDLADDAGIARRNGQWEALRPGERITGVRGQGSRIGFLCGEVLLDTSAGRAIAFRGGNPNAFDGTPFSCALPGGEAVGAVVFDDGEFVRVRSVPARDEAGAAEPVPSESADAGGS